MPQVIGNLTGGKVFRSERQFGDDVLTIRFQTKEGIEYDVEVDEKTVEVLEWAAEKADEHMEDV